MISDCLIIGGGVMGLMTARELLAKGLSVTLLDQQQIGKAASWASGGILSPLCPWHYPEAINVLARESQNHYPVLTQQLKDETGIDPEWRQSGLLLLNIPDQEAAMTWAKKHETAFERLTQKNLTNREPLLNQKFSSAFYLPTIAQVRPPRLLKALQHQLEKNPKAKLYEHTPALKLELQNQRCVGVVTPQRIVQGGVVIITAGAWSSLLLNALLTCPTIVPVRGQMLLYQSALSSSIRSILIHNAHYVIPRSNDHLLVGSTLEEVGFNSEITGQATQELKAAAKQLIPALGNVKPIRQWAGLRPSSPNHVPFMTQIPGYENLYLNAGHFRNGITLAPASARLLAELILKKEPFVDPTPYQLQ